MRVCTHTHTHTYNIQAPQHLSNKGKVCSYSTQWMAAGLKVKPEWRTINRERERERQREGPEEELTLTHDSERQYWVRAEYEHIEEQQQGGLPHRQLQNTIQ